MPRIASDQELEDRKPTYALAREVDLAVLRFDDKLSVLDGR